MTSVEAVHVRQCPTTQHLAAQCSTTEQNLNQGERPALCWRSTFSESNGCIEVAFVGVQVGFRDSKDRSHPY
jgi:Domain of unknown function (DUF397)